MKKSTSYIKNEKFRNWLDKKWLRQEKRWAFCYRRHLRNIISTTNGIETQYKDIKHHYLKEFGIGKSLTNVTEVLLEKFFPDAEMSYKRENAEHGAKPTVFFGYSRLFEESAKTISRTLFEPLTSKCCSYHFKRHERV
ncbi:hypothetical protein ScPMuIL_007068 [Solemya velum]